MRIFQSSLNYSTFQLINDYCPNVRINLLRSFGQDDTSTFRILSEFPHLIDKKILDSGVYSKFTNPEKYKHTCQDYGVFLLKYANLFDYYFSYDEDFRELEKDELSSKNEENQRYLEYQGLNPIPVLHNLEEKEVQYYIELKNKYPIVAIGSNAISMPNFKSAVQEFKNNSIKVHAFKIGSADKLQGLPVWSADCSSHSRWTSGGRVVFFNNLTKKDTSFPFRRFTKKGQVNDDFFKDNHLYHKYKYFLRSVVGIEFRALVKDSNYRTFANSIYFWWLERYVSCHNRTLNIRFSDDLEVDCTNFINYFE